MSCTKKRFSTCKMHVLYVGRDRDDPSEYCPGSLVCMTIAEKLDNVEIQIQDCNILRQSQQLPEWLNGTPILVERADPRPLRGTDAVRFLQSLLRQQERVVEPAPTKKAPPRGAMPRMEPQTTRQPGKPRDVERSSEQFSEAVDEESEDEPMDTMTNGASNAQIRDDKVTEQDLQRYMEARKQSSASAPVQQQQ